MNREQEKNDIVTALKELRTITNKVCDVFCNVDEGFLNEIISGPDYPYELSFDEQCLKIIDWIDTSIERSRNL